jgi:transcriptional regulator with XRE-family HTH domain
MMGRKLTPDENIIYPNRLRQIRNNAGLKVIDIASLIGVALATVYRWEAGTNYCDSRAIQFRLWKAYGTDPESAYPTCWQQIFGDMSEDTLT